MNITKKIDQYRRFRVTYSKTFDKDPCNFLEQELPKVPFGVAIEGYCSILLYHYGIKTYTDNDTVRYCEILSFSNPCLQRQIINNFPIEDKDKKKILDKMDKSNEKGELAIVFSHQQILLLIIHIFRLCTKKVSFSDKDKEKEYFTKLTKASLAVNDLLLPPIDENDSFQITQQVFSFTENESYKILIKITRGIIEIASESKDYEKNISDPFKKKTNISIKDWVDYGEEVQYNISENYKEQKNFLTKIHLKEKFARNISKDPKDLKAEICKKRDLDINNFVLFKTYPVLHHPNGEYSILDLQYLKDTFTIEGIYWRLFDGGGMGFRTYFGPIIEKYVKQQFTKNTGYHVYDEKPTEIIKSTEIILNIHQGKKEKENVDMVIVKNDYTDNIRKIFFIEIKSGLVSFNTTGLYGDIKTYKCDIEKIIVKACSQIITSIENFKSGCFNIGDFSPENNDQYYPVIILYKSLPIYYYLWDKYMMPQIKEKLQDSDKSEIIDRLQIISIYELEQMFEQKLDFADSVIDKDNSEFKKQPMINYIYDKVQKRVPNF